MTGAPLEPRSPLPVQRVYQSAELVALLTARKQSFVTFVGFGELGYEDEKALRSIVRAELDTRTRSRTRTVVNTGTLVTDGFHPGITEVYEISKRMGFATSGIHPSLALEDPSRHRVSSHVDETFFVDDDSWGGYAHGTRRASPTLQVLVAVSSEVIAIGGGRHAADELREFTERGVPVRFHEAEMNHSVGSAWYREQGITEVDFGGDARRVWRALRDPR